MDSYMVQVTCWGGTSAYVMSDSVPESSMVSNLVRAMMDRLEGDGVRNLPIALPVAEYFVPKADVDEMTVDCGQVYIRGQAVPMMMLAAVEVAVYEK